MQSIWVMPWVSHTAKVGLDQGIGEEGRVLPAHPDFFEHLPCPAPQRIRREHDAAFNTCHARFSFLRSV